MKINLEFKNWIAEAVDALPNKENAVINTFKSAFGLTSLKDEDFLPMELSEIETPKTRTGREDIKSIIKRQAIYQNGTDLQKQQVDNLSPMSHDTIQKLVDIFTSK
jgi:hypothetical protein